MCIWNRQDLPRRLTLFMILELDIGRAYIINDTSTISDLFLSAVSSVVIITIAVVVSSVILLIGIFYIKW